MPGKPPPAQRQMHPNATFVVDRYTPFLLHLYRKGGTFMQEWALPEINMQLCDQCGTCAQECPTGAVEMGPTGPLIVRPDDCTYCALCDAICPQGAITCPYEIVWESKD
jgi:ferredoxin